MEGPSTLNDRLDVDSVSIPRICNSCEAGLPDSVESRQMRKYLLVKKIVQMISVFVRADTDGPY
jgi:hypothetical protein